MTTVDWDSAILDDFEFLSTTGTMSWLRVAHNVGTGRYGRVRLSRHKITGQYFAIKTCPRSKLLRVDQVRHAISERAVLLSIDHTFIVKLYA